ncbi:MAG: hypothetical protein ACT4P6_23090 [Gemmatimonadaceae bacterium]
MHSFVLAAHNVVRWLVILTAVVALIRSFRGIATGAPWTRREAVSLSSYAGALSLQMLLGLFLYFFLSPLGMRALGDMGAAMRDPSVRYFAVEHPIAMMLGVALAHVAVARTRRASTDANRFRNAAVLVSISLLLVLVRTPWARPLVPQF